MGTQGLSVACLGLCLVVVTRPAVRQGTGLMPEGPSVPEEQILGAAVWQLVRLEGATGEAHYRDSLSAAGTVKQRTWPGF